LRTTEIIRARGHENITSRNRTTLEITKETHLTKRGDCIIAVAADKGAADLSPEFKQNAKNQHARITITIQAGTETERINAHGNPQLTFTHPHDLVIRKSDYTCSRTLAVHADKAAKDLAGTLVQRLRDPKQEVVITFTVDNPT
jgi:hypothetical protein